MQIGKLNHRVMFQKRIQANDEYGNTETSDWGNVVDAIYSIINVWGLPAALTLSSSNSSIWAAFSPQFGREALTSGRIDSSVKGVLTIRYVPGLSLLAPDMRVVFTSGPYIGKTFNILSITQLSDRRWCEIAIEEKVWLQE